MPSSAERRRRRADLVQHVHRADSASEVFAIASTRLRRLVPFDAAALLGVDPGTGLPTSPARIDHLDGITRSTCAEHWEQELLGTDVNLFRDLARAPRPAAALRATVEQPTRSARYRRFLQPLGLHDELRAVLRVGDSPWGSIPLWRRDGQPPFRADDVEMLASLSAPVAEALRRHARPVAMEADDGGLEQPGLLLFDVEGEIISGNDAARYWLEELPDEPGVGTDYGVVPVWLLITVFRAAAVRHGAGDGTARTHVRTRRRRWLACHASCLRGVDGTTGNVALVIEPAQAGAVAPLVVEAYDLTDREKQIVQLLARGLGTAEIADTLFLSRHTVRDHIKAIYAKAGVSSRGELVAQLFAAFYAPLHDNDVVRAPAS